MLTVNLHIFYFHICKLLSVVVYIQYVFYLAQCPHFNSLVPQSFWNDSNHRRETFTVTKLKYASYIIAGWINSTSNGIETVNEIGQSKSLWRYVITTNRKFYHYIFWTIYKICIETGHNIPKPGKSLVCFFFVCSPWLMLCKSLRQPNAWKINFIAIINHANEISCHHKYCILFLEEKKKKHMFFDQFDSTTNKFATHYLTSEIKNDG